VDSFKPVNVTDGLDLNENDFMHFDATNRETQMNEMNNYGEGMQS
jgi:hypothetical protein